MNKIHFLVFIFTLSIISCQTDNNSKKMKIDDSVIEEGLNNDLSVKELDPVFPELKDLNSLNSTTFIPTLENTFDSDINTIYAATLCMAWKEIQDTIGSKIKNCENKDLTLMTNSNSYLNVLNKNEYTTMVNVTEDSVTNLRIIQAMAYFKKALPFEYPLTKYENGLAFKSINVLSFGFNHEGPAKILYYNNDDDFALKLIPKDSDHEIILLKKEFNKLISMQNEIKKLENNIKIFSENRSSNNRWKYNFNRKDKVRIPIINFHLEHDFNDIIGSHFYTFNNTPFQISRFYQKNAFILDENGAIVESLAIEEAVEEAVEEELQKAKNLIFDKPFLILLKRESNEFPYFAVYIANTELMKRVK